jgi:hypothetical protein
MIDEGGDRYDSAPIGNYLSIRRGDPVLDASNAEILGIFLSGFPQANLGAYL